MLVASAINWFGSGLFHTSVAVFAVAVLSVGPATVGIAFALGGVVGILLSVLVGRFADQRDAKAVLVGAYAVPGGAPSPTPPACTTAIVASASAMAWAVGSARRCSSRR
jgi:hypothetical protein